MQKVFLKAHGNNKIGLGHLIRSLALAEMLSSQFETTFIYSEDLQEELVSEITSTCSEAKSHIVFKNLLDEADHLKSLLTKNDIIVLDGYFFDTTYQKTIKSSGAKLVSIDDIHQTHFISDVIINHSGGFKRSDYSLENYTKLYTGLEYCLLRRAFRNAAKNKDWSLKKYNEVLISFGGADPQNATLEVLNSTLKQNKNLNFNVVLGSAYQHVEKIESLQKEGNLKIFRNLSSDEMLNLMKKCGLAITPPSTTAYEYLSTGGNIFLKVIASNQEQMFDYLIRENIAYDFDKFNTSSIEKNHLKQVDIFDGNQEQRILSIFKDLENS